MAEAFARNDSEITLLIASISGKNESVNKEIGRLGGTVSYRDDDVGYIRARVPIEHIEALAALKEVQSVNIDGRFMYFTGEPDSGGDVKSINSLPRATPPGPNTPAESPYSPAGFAGATQFIANHPTFDGRGVTIGIIEGSPADAMHPVLQAATTLDGRQVPKITDIITSRDPFEDAGNSILNMADQIHTSEKRFSYHALDYTVSRDGVYRIGFYSNRDERYAVLWDEATKSVWVDVNGDRSFVNDKEMKDFRIRRDIGLLGADNPATPVRESLPFVVQILPKERCVGVLMLSGSHATAVASAAAGKGFFGGKMNGIAPEAQIVMINGATSNVHGAIEAFILATKHPLVDVVSASFAGFVPMNDGHSVLSVICDRLIEKFNKPIFVSADNGGPGLNIVQEYSNGDRVISVGSYIHRDTWRAVYGTTPTKEHYIPNISARGPREDGGFKPDLVAPSGGIYADLLAASGRPLTDAYTLPPGYRAEGPATSFSAPAAAGAAALLISAARQTDVPYSAERLGWALKSSAKFLSGYNAHDQGSGLINVGSAWNMLRHASEPVVITSRASVKTVLSRDLSQPNEGPGIYEREGWVKGQKSQRTIAFRRSSGSSESIEYIVRWIGTDGTFTSPRKILLPFDKTVVLPVFIRPSGTGVYSAILELIDSRNFRSAYRVMNTIVVADQFTSQNAFAIARRGQAEWLSYKSYFFNIPPNTSAVRFDLEVDNGNVLLDFCTPYGFEDAMRPRLRDPGRGPFIYKTEKKLTRTYVNPEPGVWEIIIENEGLRIQGSDSTSRSKAAFNLTASIVSTLSKSVSAETKHTEEIPKDTARVDFMNSLGAYTGAVVPTSMGSAFSARPLLTAGQAPKIYEIDVLPGTESMRVKIDGQKSKNEDIDLYLFNCTGGVCMLDSLSTRDGTQESLQVFNPAIGKWKVVLDPVRTPPEGLLVDYFDIFTNPSYGIVKGTGLAALHTVGQHWTENVTIHTGEAKPTTGRYFAGIVEVSSPDLTITLPPVRGKDGKAAEPRRVPIGTAFIDLRKHKN